MNKLFAVFLTIGICVLPTVVFGKTITTEAEVTLMVSPEVEVVTAALPPIVKVDATGREGELRLSLDVDGDSTNTQYKIRELTTGKYVNPLSGFLDSVPAWGVYDDWGADRGVIVRVGALPEPMFAGVAKNMIGEESISSSTVSPLGTYRATREPVMAITEGIMYGLGIVLFAGLAIYQLSRMRLDDKIKTRKSRIMKKRKK